jgi:hypothetical protein
VIHVTSPGSPVTGLAAALLVRPAVALHAQGEPGAPLRVGLRVEDLVLEEAAACGPR